MHSAIPLTEKVFWVGVNDHETDLFEALWPLPYGISYNAYLIVDDRTVLVDAVKGHFLDEHVNRIREALPAGRSIDYLVVNHVEPDHTGALRILRELFPGIRVVGNKKTLELLAGFYGAGGDTHVVQDGDVLDLGTHRLTFHLTPMVHWPETMMTFEASTGILFSGDAFGGYGTVDRGLFDDEMDLAFFESETLRYYANIIGRYSQMVQKAIAKVGTLGIKILAPTHGAVWRTQPRVAVDWYDRWSRQETKSAAVVAYGSMYGNTQKMAERVARALVDAGVHTLVHNLSHSHASYVLRDIWTSRALVLASPTYNTGLFPTMDDLVRLLKNKLIKDRLLGVVGSYGWTGGAAKALTAFAERSKWRIVEPVVEVRCAAGDQDLERCAQLGRNLAAAVRA